MSVSISRLTVPAYLRGLQVLSRYLDKAAAHADAAALADVRLAPDMLPLAGQIQRASDTSKNAVARLLGTEAPRFEDNETTLAELKARVEKTIAFIAGADAAALDAGAAREITLAFGDFRKTFDGEDYVLSYRERAT